MEFNFTVYGTTFVKYLLLAGVFGYVQYLVCQTIPRFKGVVIQAAMLFTMISCLIKSYALFSVYALTFGEVSTTYLALQLLYLIPYFSPYIASKKAVKFAEKKRIQREQENGF
ncbi:hypothetical protein [Tannockella kyphosi]|uniref:hypothetical protein n=1 Tax=Tannockella kyphosi TaxID=2899121 RepID=UPI0020113BA6|nr:hypothetical protein [Tannockella kyphosi]